MENHFRRDDVEIAGALVPELEGAGHTKAHPRRFPSAGPDLRKRGDSPSVKTDLPPAPKRP